jgi:hypothetical protein
MDALPCDMIGSLNRISLLQPLVSK